MKTKVKSTMKLTTDEYNAVKTGLELFTDLFEDRKDELIEIGNYRKVDDYKKLDVNDLKSALDKFNRNKSCKFIKKASLGKPRYVHIDRDYNTHNDLTINIDGTSLKGRIDASYDELVKVFGNPHNGDEYKTDAQWDIRFGDGELASIYNYKDGMNYNNVDEGTPFDDHDEGTPTSDIRDWHIGGHKKEVVGRIYLLLQQPYDPRH